MLGQLRFGSPFGCPCIVFASEQIERYTELAQTGAGTIQRLQQAQSDFTQRRPALQRATAALAAALAQREALRSQVEDAKANAANAQAAVDQAKLNLLYPM